MSGISGGRWKRGLWWNCEPTSLPKGRGWKPSTYGCARQRSTRRVERPCGYVVDKRASERMNIQNTGEAEHHPDWWTGPGEAVRTIVFDDDRRYAVPDHQNALRGQVAVFSGSRPAPP